MLLILTNSEDVTADYLVSVLSQHEIAFLRFDTDTMLHRLTFSFDGHTPLIRVGGVAYRPQDFSNVWYRRPERLKHPRFEGSPEGGFVLEEWSEALEGFFAQIEKPKWMNHPSCNVAASHKVEQLVRARALGLPVPDTLVTQEPDQLRAFYEKHGGQVIVKPMANGYVERPKGEQDSLIYTNRVPAGHLADLDDLPACPTLFQEEIAKVADVRITMVDHDTHAVELIARESDGSQRCDIRRNNMEDVSYRVVNLPEDVEQRIRALAAHYGLRFAAIDMAVTRNGEWVFFEINPNGQWAWLDLAGNTSIAASFVNAFHEN
jgi:hypothetical protein